MVVANSQRQRALRLVSAKINRGASTTCDKSFVSFALTEPRDDVTNLLDSRYIQDNLGF